MKAAEKKNMTRSLTKTRRADSCVRAKWLREVRPTKSAPGCLDALEDVAETFALRKRTILRRGGAGDDPATRSVTILAELPLPANPNRPGPTGAAKPRAPNSGSLAEGSEIQVGVIFIPLGALRNEWTIDANEAEVVAAKTASKNIPGLSGSVQVPLVEFLLYCFWVYSSDDWSIGHKARHFLEQSKAGNTRRLVRSRAFLGVERVRGADRRTLGKRDSISAGHPRNGAELELVPCRHQPRDERLQSLERSRRDSHFLANAYFGIDREDFVFVTRFFEAT